MARARATTAEETAATEVSYAYTCEGTSGITSCTATLGDATITKRFFPDSPETRAALEDNLAKRLRGETTDAPTFGVTA